MADVTNYMTPEEINAYQTRRNQTDTSAMLGLAKNTYARTQAGIDQGIDRTKFAKSWDEQYRTLGNQGARRGILRSGIQKRAEGNYGWARGQAQNDMDLAQTRQTYGFNQQATDIGTMQTFAQDQIESERLARQSRLAAQIQGVQ